MAETQSQQVREFEVQAPPPFDGIIKKALATDRQYFMAHPKKRFYVRSYIPGEVWPITFPTLEKVEVSEIIPSWRTRTFFPSIYSMKYAVLTVDDFEP